LSEICARLIPSEGGVPKLLSNSSSSYLITLAGTTKTIITLHITLCRNSQALQLWNNGCSRRPLPRL